MGSDVYNVYSSSGCDWVLMFNVVQVGNRDVTKFAFEFDNVRTSTIFRTFDIRRMLSTPCNRMQIYQKVDDGG